MAGPATTRCSSRRTWMWRSTPSCPEGKVSTATSAGRSTADGWTLPAAAERYPTRTSSQDRSGSDRVGRPSYGRAVR